MPDGSQIESSTLGSEPGGTLTVTASESVEVVGTSANGQFVSGLLTQVYSEATGAGGNLTLQTGRLTVRDGAQVSVGTFGTGAGGTLSIAASDAIELIGRSADGRIGSGLFAQAEGEADAGDLTIATRRLTVRDGALVSVRSIESGNAGNLEVTADSIRLDNQAALSANTTAGQGNIILRSGDLVLRRGSNIRTDATGTATGGNITIDAGVIAALENSDISANAQNARGGQVIIDAQAIFGTEFRNRLTPESDITATSDLGPEFSGTVELNTPDVDPNRGLVNLPTQPTETEVAQACTPGGSQAQSEFIITGRGGLPPSPNDALSSDAIQVDWVTLNSGLENRSSPDVSTNQTSPTPTPIVEAQGWVIAPNGEVILTASAPTATPHSSWQTPVECHGS